MAHSTDSPISFSSSHMLLYKAVKISSKITLSQQLGSLCGNMESRSIIFLLFLSIRGALADTWIVAPTENCSRSNCHNLSYYTDDPSLYFSTDTTLIFLEGVHYLYEPVTISGVSNLTLQGEGVLQDGSHWTVRESTVVIHCSNSEAGLFFVNWTGITINNITLESCGAQITSDPTLVSDINTHYSSLPYGWEFGVGLKAHHSLLFVNGSDLTLESVTIQRGTGYGLTIVNSYDIDINGSYFYKNNYQYLCNDRYDQAGGNIRITHLPLLSSSIRCPDVNKTESLIIIRNTRVSFGVNQRIQDSSFMALSRNLTIYAQSTLPLGGGIGLVPADYSCNRFRYKLENIIAFENYAFYSGSNFAMIVLPVPISISGMLSTRGFTASHCPVPIPPAIISETGSGMTFSVFDSLESGISSELNITDLVSINNIAVRGSGLYISTHAKQSWNSINIKSSNFTRNVVSYTGASAVYIERRDIAEIPSSLIVSLTDVSINETVNSMPTTDNLNPRNGALSLVNIDCVINGLLIANSVNIRGLALASSRVFVQGDNLIHNNTALLGSGGGVHMDPNSFFIFQPPANLTFSRNHADQYGGGICISPRANRAYSPPCFFQIDSLLPSPQVKLSADGNTAGITGTFISGGELVYCSFVTNFYYSYCGNTNSSVPFCSYKIMKNFIVPNTSTQDRFFISSVPVAVLLCNDNSNISFDDRKKAVSVMPGQSFALKLVALSETEGIAPGNIHSSANGVTTTNTINANCTELSFTYYKPIGARDIIITFTTDHSVKYIFASIKPLRVNLTYTDCPPFFQLVNNSTNSSICGCNSYIANAAESAVCNINTSRITTTYNEVTNWIGYDNNSNCTFVGRCPFGYCVDEEVTFTINDIDAQCAPDRSGVLCGGCAEGFSIKLGSNECGQCSNSYLSLLLVFGIAGVVLVIFLILLNLTVTIGTINGLIFFANIVKIVEPILFQTGPIRVLSQFISWINLDFGIKVCFYDGMTPSHKIWWQFAFPIYIWIIIGIITIAVKKMTNHRFFEPITRYFIHLKLVNIFATLLFLSYTKLIRAIVIILARANLQCDDESMNRWAYDGTLEFMKGRHLPLFIFGICFLCLFVIPYTLFLFALPVIERLTHFSERFPFIGRLWLKVKPFTDAYASPFKDKCRFWVGFLILIRLVVAGTYAGIVDTELKLLSVFYTILFTLTVSLMLKGPYTNDNLNRLENWFLINLLGILAFGLNESKYYYFFFQFSVFITFVCIIIFHSYCRFKGHFDPKASLKKIKKFHLSKYSNTTSTSLISNEETADDSKVIDTGYVSADSNAPKIRTYSKYRNSALDLMDDFIN